MAHRTNEHAPIKLVVPPHSFARAEKKDVKLAEEIIENIAGQYNPMEAIKGLKIVL